MGEPEDLERVLTVHYTLNDATKGNNQVGEPKSKSPTQD